MSITIKKESEEVTYKTVTTEVVFLINNKKLRVSFYESLDDLDANDYEINEDDKVELTDEEYEVFQDENIWDLARLKVGKILKCNTDIWK